MTPTNYIQDNKAAWEGSFANRTNQWGDDNYLKLQNETLPFFHPDVKAKLKELDFAGKAVAQFCCNNGRELLSLSHLGIARGVGFDIAENILEQARHTAKHAGIDTCEFVATSILEIPQSYHEQFDYVLITIGALCWFEDLALFFEQVAKCLKPGGQVIISEGHPFLDMIPVPGDEGYDPDNLNKVVFSYFRTEPWIENKGMGYMGDRSGVSKTFTSFSHTMSERINAMATHGIYVTELHEYDYEIGSLAPMYSHKGMPLSYIMLAKKMQG